MSRDPLTTYEAAEADAIERHDETVYENDWAEAVEAARAVIADFSVSTVGDIRDSNQLMRAVYVLVSVQDAELLPAFSRSVPSVRVLADFEANHGTPALLRALAQAIELEHGK